MQNESRANEQMREIVAARGDAGCVRLPAVALAPRGPRGVTANDAFV
jgi:hypothetical protein